MKVTLEQTKKLLMEGDLVFHSLVFSFMVTHLRKLYTKAPSDRALEDCNSAINTFLDKFKDSMTEDFEIIAKL